MHTHKVDVIVVGGGLAGLTAAAYLAKAGRAVTLIEKSSSLGGRAITRNLHGFSFNRGVHALYLNGEGEQVLRELGIAYSGKNPDLSRYMGVYEERIVRLPYSIQNVVRTNLFSVREKMELVKLFATRSRHNIESLRGTSLRTWAENTIQSERIREYIYSFARIVTYTHAPELLDASFFVEIFQMNPTVLYLDHGWQTLVDGLVQVARQHGVDILTGSRVAALEFADKSVRGVHLENGTIYEANATILATESQHALQLLGDRQDSHLHDWAQQNKPLYAAVLDLGLRRLPQPTYINVAGVGSPFYSVAMSDRATLAPAGQALLHTIRYFHPDEEYDARSLRCELEAWLDLIQPGWRAEVIEEQFLPHIQVAGGMILARTGGLGGLPQSAQPQFDNLYLAGDWVRSKVHLGGASLDTARQAAQLILQRTRQPLYA